MAPADTAPGLGAQRLCIEVETHLPLNQHGSYVAARLTCKAISNEPAYLILEPGKDRLTLTAACGCHVYVPLSTWLADLAKVVREGHRGDNCPVPAATATTPDQPQQEAAAPAHLH